MTSSHNKSIFFAMPSTLARSNSISASAFNPTQVGGVVDGIDVRIHTRHSSRVVLSGSCKLLSATAFTKLKSTSKDDSTNVVSIRPLMIDWSFESVTLEPNASTFNTSRRLSHGILSGDFASLWTKSPTIRNACVASASENENSVDHPEGNFNRSTMTAYTHETSRYNLFWMTESVVPAFVTARVNNLIIDARIPVGASHTVFALNCNSSVGSLPLNSDVSISLNPLGGSWND
mmetsp:Transcript_36255/g.87357  ORF Transcript_36255/g.87357 Transcript_36255/m.87357 type:complete len:233 (-) Transcript_36255:11665-12363(-)